ncbi:SchA/CurD-like domain-containing protein [Streptacidiphilus neutrinimicus]|uniref:SchA/CurD-like domain-containing protein n=1 Tax=Streptacidiphilus neutrinimicus TaxID=105420 RepID=UPI0005AAB254|nr:SchA/CurD-like domain-containing protein [Streptacidiphilus neutrinimicus]
MPFAAIQYDIKPGFEKELAEIFGSFKRVGSSSVQGRPDAAPGADAPAPTTRILSTAVFLRDATMVRFIEYEGDLQEVAWHMAAQPGVQEVEAKLKPYLSKPRDTGTPEGFVATFNRSLLPCLTQISVRG